MFRESAVRRRAADLCAADPCGDSGGADMGEETAFKVLGTVHCPWGHVLGKPAGAYHLKNISGRRIQE